MRPPIPVVDLWPFASTGPPPDTERLPATGAKAPRREDCATSAQETYDEIGEAFEGLPLARYVDAPSFLGMVGDVAELSFTDERFDLAIAVMLLNYVEKIDEFELMCRRVTRA